MAQRLFLITLLKEPFIVPMEDPDEGEFLRADGGANIDFDGQYIQEDLRKYEQKLGASSRQSLFQRMADSENSAFRSAKTQAVNWANDLAQDCREDLRRFFWRTFQTELRNVAESTLSAFRKVAEISDEQANLAEAECQRFQQDPGAFEDSDVAQFYLDAEVLRDDRRRRRLWDVFYRHKLDRSAYFDTKDIFEQVTAAFQPVRDADGQMQAQDASTIVRTVRESLAQKSVAIYRQALETNGMDLAVGLDLEQRYIALLDDGASVEELANSNDLEEAVKQVQSPRVQSGIEDRLKRLSDECVLLAHIDHSRADDPTVTPANVFYVGLADRFGTDEDDSLGNIVRQVIGGVNFAPGWNDPDAMVLYRAKLGVPVYFFKNVETILDPAYRRVHASPNRSYPLHIEAAWESELPNLKPMEIKQAEERRVKEAQAQQAAASREQRVRDFTLCLLFGMIAEQEGQFVYISSGVSIPLGANRGAAYQAFDSLDAMMRDDLISDAEQAWTAKHADRRTRPALLLAVETHEKRLKGALAEAIRDMDDPIRDLIKEERAIVSEMLVGLRA